MPGQQRADDLPRTDRLTCSDSRFYWLIGGADPVGVVDGDHRTPGHHAGECDRPRGGAADLRALRGRKVHAAVPASPYDGRRIEALHHGGRCTGRPLIASSRPPELMRLLHSGL